MNYLAIDFGQKNIGIAYKIGGDPVVPSDTINYQNQSDLISQIKKIIEDKEIEKVIVGMPYNLKGEKGHQAKIVEEFIELMTNNIKIPIDTSDERLSSAIFGLNQKNIDSYSAAEILQSYISRKNINQKNS